MIFTELTLQNFGPYAGRQVIDLRPDTQEIYRPIILIGGMNGGGKTTLIDAIRLALYGQRAQCSTRNQLSYNDFLLQCINHQVFPIDSTRIELELEYLVAGQWKTLRIVRHWTKQLKDGKDTLGIVSEEWPDENLAEAWDEYIESLLPLGISNLFLFDGEQVKELAEQETPPLAVIEAIQSLLGLELAEKLAIDLDILCNRKRKSLANTQALKTIEELEAKIALYEEEAEHYGQQLTTLQNQLGKAQANHQVALDKFRIEGGKIAAEKSKIESKIQDLAKTEENNRQSLVDLAYSSLPLALISSLLEVATQQGKQEIRQKKIESAKDILRERDCQLLSYLPQISIESEQIEKIAYFLEQENRKLYPDNINYSRWLNIEEETLKQLETLLTYQLKEQVQSAQKQIKEQQQQEKDLERLQQQLTTAASPEAYENLEKNLKLAHKALIQYQTALEKGEKNYQEAQKNIEKTKKALEKFSEESISHHQDEFIFQSISKAQQTLKFFKEKLTLKKLNKLENEVTECFRYLLHKSDLVHRVAIDTYNFKLSLFSPEGKTVAKHRLSAGEKQLLAIAFLWGLARVSGRQLPIAIDTPLGRLDSSHRDHLVERYFPSASHQVILLSTDTEIAESEVKKLRQQDTIASEYLLKYDPESHQTTIQPNTYFW